MRGPDPETPDAMYIRLLSGFFTAIVAV